MSGPWMDRETGIVIEYCSAYQGECSYQFKAWREGAARPDVTRFRTNMDSPDECVPQLRPYYDTDRRPTDVELGAWERYCQHRKREFEEWCWQRGFNPAT